MKVYIAGSWARKSEVVKLAEKVEAAGIQVTSRWLSLPDIKNYDESCKAAEAEHDLEDIDKADAFILFNMQKSEGKATELGYALASGIPILLVGERKGNIFYHMPSITQFDDLSQLLKFLRD